MPGIATHHMFGADVYGKASPVIGERASDLDAFLLGNLGPDPFFYLAATPSTRKLRRIGQTMHRSNTDELLRSVHERLVKSEADGPLAAYALGFLCHYLLDSTVHPLVYAQQHAICSVGLERLKGEWSHRIVHTTIETALDEYVLTTRLGATAATLPPHKTMLRCAAGDLVQISNGLSDVVEEVYEIHCPDIAFATAVSLFRSAQRALDSKSAGLRKHVDYLDIAGAASKYVLALSHRADPLPRTPFTNDDHVPWPRPFAEGEVVDASFDELYTSALNAALDTLPAYAQREAAPDLFASIVQGTNFLGRPA